MKSVLEFFKNLWMQYLANIDEPNIDDPNIDDLCAAIEKGDFDGVNCLLKVKRIQDELESYHNDILCFAVVGGHLEIVTLLLMIDIVKNNITANENRAFDLADENGHVEVRNLLWDFPDVKNASQKNRDKRLEISWNKYIKYMKNLRDIDNMLRERAPDLLSEEALKEKIPAILYANFSKTESSRDGASKRAREESLSNLAQAEPPKKRRKTELDKLVIDGESALIFNESEFPRRSKRVKKEALNDSEQVSSSQKKRKG